MAYLVRRLITSVSLRLCWMDGELHLFIEMSVVDAGIVRHGFPAAYRRTVLVDPETKAST
jgi:hypothetical protein